MDAEELQEAAVPRRKAQQPGPLVPTPSELNAPALPDVPAFPGVTVPPEALTLPGDPSGMPDLLDPDTGPTSPAGLPPEPADAPAPDDGIWGAVTMQLILSVLLVIGFLGCRLLAPQVSAATVSLLQEKTLHDFSFRDALLEQVRDAAAFLESLTPLDSAASEAPSDPGASGSAPASLPASSDSAASPDAAALTGQPLDFSPESLNGQGGSALPSEYASLPSNVSFAPVIFTGSLQFPLQGVWRQTSSFGFRDSPLDEQASTEFHAAVDLAAAQGEPILAIFGGVVTESGQSSWLGNYIRIDHGNGFYSTYGHCSRLIAREGIRVRRGEVIAEVGSSGQSTGPHLHLALEKDGICFDPAWVFPDRLDPVRSVLFP